MESPRVMHLLEFIETELDKFSENPEIGLELQPEKADSFKQLSLKLYSCAVSSNKNCKGKFLPKLHIDGFDTEQIWQQCDLLNKAALPNLALTVRNLDFKHISDAISKINKTAPLSTNPDSRIIESGEDDFSDAESNDEEYAFDDDSDSPTEMEVIVRGKTQDKENKKSDDVFHDDSDSPTEMESVRKKPPVKEKKKSSCNQVDDQFFKLSKLEEFLKVEDLKEEKNIERDLEDDDIDLFQDIPSDDVEDFDDKEEEKPLKSSKDLMYADFFDAPESEGDEDGGNMDDHDETMIEEDDETSFHEHDSTVEMRDDLGENDNSEAESEKSYNNKNVQKTAFELEQEKIRKKIQEYEKSMVEPLPWHLTGEVDATNRPIDSLIHKETDFDSNVKEDLIVDNVLTENIEEIVRMAIINKAFNDVERKYKPTEGIAYKKEKVLEQTKSAKSLAEVYEDEYLKKQNKQNEDEEDPKHKEIKKLMDSLFPELYALFSHIPVPAVPDIKIVSNLPAVTVEEVAPVTMNDATLLAPEEVKKKSGQIKNKAERTDTDRKRERRKKKLHQKLKEKKRLAKLESQKGNPSAKVTKLEKLQTLKKLKQHKNTKIATVDDGGKIKSSKDFFSRLQDTVDTKIRTKSADFSKKKKKK